MKHPRRKRHTGQLERNTQTSGTRTEVITSHLTKSLVAFSTGVARVNHEAHFVVRSAGLDASQVLPPPPAAEPGQVQAVQETGQ